MKALITGAGGFVGGHLARYLLTQPETTVIGTTYESPQSYPTLASGGHYQQINITDRQSVLDLLEEHQPDHIYHLAAQTFVPTSFEDPWDTLETNIRGQLNFLEGMRLLPESTRILVLGSGEEYGIVSPEDMPLKETQPLRPTSPYSVSKVAQEMLGLQYHLSYGIQTIRVRAFNHTGPGQSKRFVAPAFASQIAAIEARQQEPVVRVGNLEARRDFTDVRDIVRAYHLLMLHGEPGEVYNVGSGTAHSIDELLHALLGLSEADIRVEADAQRMRPVEVPVIVCDPTRLRSTTGWEPAISFEQSMADVLNDWRERISQS
ncbi:MAG: GDP-mannose 4,6-dehydratase [Chloroflexi bacterium]|nr:GDP-mannose 4,6-dehydratase [Chloroflexota bacterium]